MMRQFYQLRDEVFSGRWHLGDIRTEGGVEPLLDAGQKFDGSQPLIAEVTWPGRVLDFCLTSFAVPVATRSVAQAVSVIAGTDVQCLPVAVAGHPGMQVLNSVRVIRCLDEKQSDFLKWTEQDHRPDLAGQYKQVTKLKIAPSAIPSDAHFFRIEGWLVALIVSDVVKAAMEREGCTGAKFVDVTPSK